MPFMVGGILNLGFDIAHYHQFPVTSEGREFGEYTSTIAQWPVGRMLSSPNELVVRSAVLGYSPILGLANKIKQARDANIKTSETLEFSVLVNREDELVLGPPGIEFTRIIEDGYLNMRPVGLENCVSDSCPIIDFCYASSYPATVLTRDSRVFAHYEETFGHKNARGAQGDRCRNAYQLFFDQNEGLE